MEGGFVSEILQYYEQNEWKKILQLDTELNKNETKKLLWVWPSEENLVFIEKIVRKYQLNGIISIGCGCGLFEWLLHKASGLPVVGYERDPNWWRSRYSNFKFIELEFPQQPPKPDIFIPNFALLFCYFNDGLAFKNYVNNYNGNVIFIIGPGLGVGRHTNPEPFKPNFENGRWELVDSQEVKDSKDFIAVYVKNN